MTSDKRQDTTMTRKGRLKHNQAYIVQQVGMARDGGMRGKGPLRPLLLIGTEGEQLEAWNREIALLERVAMAHGLETGNDPDGGMRFWVRVRE